MYMFSYLNDYHSIFCVIIREENLYWNGGVNMKLNEETERIMNARFRKDNVIALATICDGMPCVRYVNAYYEKKAFYIITHELSNKMKQISRNSNTSICGEWFSAQGKGINLGYFGKKRTKKSQINLERFLHLGLIMDIMILAISIHVFLRWN